MGWGEVLVGFSLSFSWMLCFDGSLHSSSLEEELPGIPEAKPSLGECVIDLNNLSSGRLVSPA